MGDYHRARWNALSEIVDQEKVFASDLGTSDNLYKWTNTLDQNHFILLSKKPLNSFDLLYRIRKFISTLKFKKITSVCIPGYGRIEYLFFIVISKIMNRKVVIFAESWYGENKILNKSKSIFLNYFSDLFFVSGQKAFDHFHKTLKLPAHKIIPGYSVVDNRHFFVEKCNLEQKPILLCVARFSKEKNLIRLIKAFNRSKINKEYILKLVGGGVQKEELTILAKENPNIELSDWVSYKELPMVYGKASLFILPSLFEPWGLVINEAMAAGLPIIASHQCGCVPDLVTENNGFIFNPENEQELVELLDKVTEMPKKKLLEMGNNSIKKISDYSPQKWAVNLYLGIKNLN